MLQTIYVRKDFRILVLDKGDDNMIYAIKIGKFLTQDDKMQHLV